MEVKQKTKRACLGFTMIEVLAAVAILVILVGAMAKIQASAIQSYRLQTRQAERDSNARAVMDYIGREVSQAIFENSSPGSPNTNALVSMLYRSNTTPNNFGLEGGDELWLMSASNGNESQPREGLCVVYYLKDSVGMTPEPENAAHRFRLMRGFIYPTNAAPPLYFSGEAGLDWVDGGYPSTAREIVDNVRTFEIFAYSDETGTRILNWDSRSPEPLFCMDVYLETMSEQDAITAAALAKSLGPIDSRTVEFAESVVRRHFQRIYFPNKNYYYDGVGM